MPRTKPREIPSFVYDPNCALYLPLYKRDGSTFISDDAYGHLCTVTGATWGYQGRTYASGNYITVPNTAILDFTSTDFSAWAWVKPTSVASAQMLISHGATNADGWFMLLNAGTTSGRLFIRTNQAGANQSTQSVDDAIPAGSWSCLGFSRIGADVKTYRNGVDNTTAPSVHINPVATARTLKIGINDDLAANPFVGVFGEGLVLNRGLTAQEHMRIYLSTKGRYQ